ncbi:hypothetical protein [Raineya orbicola]|jgi:hypothetical protein|uniref:Uncharacterized protein n=1 Tax=Raineya orbicola TaxID=2016530 RepID=A0A2N3IHW4_9BACT|nr:hypothetical protein [Raineya orbicola]PKQ69919.1 hypothetical protein Rain11_1116 [Raineya orbicola]
MNLFIAFLKNFSLVAFSAVWLITNAGFPTEISLNYPYNPISKHWFLYVVLGFVGIFNLLMVFFLRFLQSIPIEKLRIPQADFWKENELSREEFYNVLKAWFHTFTAFFNLYIAFLLYKIWDINVMIQDTVDMTIFWAIGLFIILFALSYIFIRFRIRKYSIWD